MQKVYAILAFFLGFQLLALSQETTENPDLLFKKAQNLAFHNQWKEAREIARHILKINEKYQDARVLIGRTYAWDHQYDSARLEINKVIASDSSHHDAIDALI